MLSDENCQSSRVRKVLPVEECAAATPGFEHILNSVPYVLWTADPNGRPNFISEQWDRAFGGDRKPLLGAGWTEFVHPDDLPGVLRQWNRSVATGEPHCTEFRMRLPDGHYRWMQVNARAETDSDGNIVRWFGGIVDVSERVQAFEGKKWEAEHDSLTSLPNRSAFQTRLQAAVLRAMASGTRLGLLLIDLDHFKLINDTVGHSAGDTLLQNLARQLRETVRRDDFVARIGGDEFAIIVEAIPDTRILLEIGNGVRERLKSTFQVHDHVVSAPASIGGAVFPDDASNANELFRVADTALYGLKSEGRGGTRLFENYMRAEAQRLASQLRLARVAVTENSVVPLYQAKVCLRDGAVRGFEALLRWDHPRHGLQMPDTILEAFNDYELASRIGELMQTKTAADIHSWINQGLRFGRVSINASPAEFLRDDYAERLLDRLRACRVPPHLIEIEVTEHVLFERGSKFVARALGVLKASGVAISLDDFGTGHSSLSHLRDFPVDTVKIDKSFVDNVTRDPEMSAIVSAVIKLAQNLGIETVAEGVETRAQAALLRKFGCDAAQGFLYARPARGDAVLTALSERFAA